VYIESKHQLQALYPQPSERAISKEVSSLNQTAIDFINTSPLVIISTFSNTGEINVSPRGGDTGFVGVITNNTLIIPDAQCNNRLDSLNNIIDTGKIGCLFLSPDSQQTLRINGEAKISINEQHLALDFGLSRPPRICIEISITQVFMHCSMSLKRAKVTLDPQG